MDELSHAINYFADLGPVKAFLLLLFGGEEGKRVL
jgi:hypothetical protein